MINNSTNKENDNPHIKAKAKAITTDYEIINNETKVKIYYSDINNNNNKNDYVTLNYKNKDTGNFSVNFRNTLKTFNCKTLNCLMGKQVKVIKMDIGTPIIKPYGDKENNSIFQKFKNFIFSF